jgi:hypothetical protein
MKATSSGRVSSHAGVCLPVTFMTLSRWSPTRPYATTSATATTAVAAPYTATAMPNNGFQ